MVWYVKLSNSGTHARILSKLFKYATSNIQQKSPILILIFKILLTLSPYRLSYPRVRYVTLSCSIVSYSIPSYHILSYYILSHPILSNRSLSSPIPSHPLLLFSPIQVKRRNDIYVCMVSHAHNVSSQGKYIAIVSTTVETDKPINELQPGFQLLGHIMERCFKFLIFHFIFAACFYSGA
jgi:GDP dissociation inhibitor